MLQNPRSFIVTILMLLSIVTFVTSAADSRTKQPSAVKPSSESDPPDPRTGKHHVCTQHWSYGGNFNEAHEFQECTDVTTHKLRKCKYCLGGNFKAVDRAWVPSDGMSSYRLKDDHYVAYFWEGPEKDKPSRLQIILQPERVQLAECWQCTPDQ